MSLPTLPGLEGLGDDAAGPPQGRVTIADRVVEKVASWAAWQVPEVGGRGRDDAQPRAREEIGRAQPARLPRVRADVGEDTAVLAVELGVRWPAPLAGVAVAVRHTVVDAVAATCGLRVTEVGVTVTELVTSMSAPRVRRAP